MAGDLHTSEHTKKDAKEVAQTRRIVSVAQLAMTMLQNVYPVLHMPL